LIVEPDVDTRLLYRTTLEPVAGVICEAEDGAEALGKAICERPSLVITEIRLPRMDGIALCSLLRKDPATADARLVVVSGAASPAIKARATDAGADAVLAKPCALDELIVTVQEVCGGNSAYKPAESPAAAPTLLRRLMKSHTHERRLTTAPPNAAPAAFCPNCATALTYLHSYTGGVSDRFPEQWDYFACKSCGTFRYRHRTRRLTPVVDVGNVPSSQYG